MDRLVAGVPFPLARARPDPGRGAAARRSLLASAIEVFGERGPEAATTRDIAQRAGQNIATIAYHFGSKEGLYLGVAEHIAQLLLDRVGGLLDEVEACLASGGAGPARLLDCLQRLLAANVATNREMLAVTAIIAREQQSPTRAFAILYDRVLERLQRAGAGLVASYVGLPPHATESVVHFHALLGEALAFRFARETVQRRAGWSRIGEAEDALIKSVVIEHASLVLRGLRARHRGHPTPAVRSPAARTAHRKRRKP